MYTPHHNCRVAPVVLGYSALNFHLFARSNTSQLDNYHRSAVTHKQVCTDLLLHDPSVTSSAVVCHNLCGEVLTARRSHSVVLRP